MPARNLELVPHVPAHLAALIESEAGYEKVSGMRVAKGVRPLLLQASPDFLLRSREATAPDPWRFGFAVLDPAQNEVIGMCGFAAPPGADQTVEIAYGIAPEHQGKGCATRVAEALIQFARQNADLRKVCAHTLPEKNASVRVLEKCGFERTGEATDSEGLRVWRWEKRVEKC